MGTKENPGKFDCHAKAALNEPTFTLRSTDTFAPWLVMMWGSLRLRDFERAKQCMDHLLMDAEGRKGTEIEKYKEALDVAIQMRAWYDKHKKGSAL